MKHAKIFSIFVFTVLLSYGVIGFYFLPMATFQGDLTRLAMLPETQFGWQKPQPQIDPTLIQQASMREADVLVVGDSFSDGRLWQTILVQKGFKVRTETWDSIRGICADFIPWLHAQGFTGKHLVIESIERNFVDDLQRSVACQHMQYHPNSYTDIPRSPPPVSFDVNQDGYTSKLSVSIKTQLHMLEYKRLRQSTDFKTWILSDQVTMARLPDGCELFSHSRCNEALFFAADKAEDINPDAVDNIAKINARLDGITPIWMVVPNKSTVYLYPDKQFWNKAEERFHTPNLLRMMRQAIRKKTVDLYPANNTHVSTTGYLLMGEEIYRNISHTLKK